jgi:hypothetical protein
MTRNKSKNKMTKKEKDKDKLGEEEENVYSDDVREDLVESGEISPEEEGFMAGYDKAEDDDEKKKDEEDED